MLCPPWVDPTQTLRIINGPCRAHARRWLTALAITTSAVATSAVATTAVATTGPAAADPAGLLEEIRAARLETDKAIQADGLALNTGLAKFRIHEGVIFPATPIGGRVVEMVFAGRATLELDPEDPIEAGQLELFTGAGQLREEVTEAAIVIALDDAADALASRRAAVVSRAEQEKAQQLFARWQERPERRLLGIETAVLRDALDDPAYQGFFAGWFRGSALGELLYLFEPDASEQVSLGQFVAFDATAKQKRKLARRLHREQRKGRLIGLEIDDLGRWDTWLSAPVMKAGQPVPGSQAFEPTHYQLEATLSGSKLELRGQARIRLERVTPGRMVTLNIQPDLRISRVALAGNELFFHQVKGEVLVVLPPETADELLLEIDYAGRAVERIEGKSYVLASPTHWYPHTGSVDLATYDVTLRWPKKLGLVAAGKRYDSGRTADGLRFERRRLEHRSRVFGFEIGAFQILEASVGNVDVTLAVDDLGGRVLDPNSRELLLKTAVDSLHFFEQIFGPYPLDQLTLVTTSRPISQSLLGFVTLSTLQMLDLDWILQAPGLVDRRTIVAHEIAHQWWGHIVGWRSYRDQWISEAMANHAAVLYARHRLRDGRSELLGPTAGWQEALTRKMPDGRPIESLGPLVLGERLESSLASDAYQPIIYQKGAVVLGMLSRIFGEEAFLAILRRVIEMAPFHQISTETLISLIEQLSGHDLTAFAEQFIYGTGLPRITYEYQFAQTDTGRWRVEGQAHRHSPSYYQYRAMPLAEGGFDVARERIGQSETTDSSLLVPFELVVSDPVAEKRQDAGKTVVVGNLRLEGESTDFSFEVDHRPLELWLDRRQQVFGRFLNQRRYPKRSLYEQGVDRAATGHHADAEDLFHRALAADTITGPDAAATSDDEIETASRWLDAGIEVELARLYLDQGRLADASGSLDRLRKLASRDGRIRQDHGLSAVEARVAIRSGQPERALRLLRQDEYGDIDVEKLLLRAIAARAAGHRDQLEDAVEGARRRGADVAAFKTAP